MQAALVIGLAILLQGVLGLAMPDVFLRVVRVFQAPPVIYLAAAIRVAVGVVLFRTAPSSRMPVALRCLGAAIFVGGLLSPVWGAQFAEVVLGWWVQGGSSVIRAWAMASLVIGVFIIYAVAGRGVSPNPSIERT